MSGAPLDDELELLELLDDSPPDEELPLLRLVSSPPQAVSVKGIALSIQAKTTFCMDISVKGPVVEPIARVEVASELVECSSW